jgi:hypothetical protein
MRKARDELAGIWRRRIAAQRAEGSGGRSIREWCRENSLPEYQFYWWRNRLGLSPASLSASRRNTPMRFAEVVLSAGGEAIRLRLDGGAGGRELILPASMPMARLAELVRELEASP